MMCGLKWDYNGSFENSNEKFDVIHIPNARNGFVKFTSRAFEIF